MLLATTVNLAILFHMSGHEEEWMCFMFCTLDVTVGILALHYVTNHPAEKELGVKAPPANQRNPSTSSVFPGTTYQASVNSDRTGQTRVWASDQYGDEEVIAAPDRIFVSTSFELYRIDEQPADDDV